MRDPWAILVAEVMLQQTQAQRVIPKWNAFLAAFPSPSACAQASLGDVLRHWQGLGYPRRARNLSSAAVAVKELHDGVVPDDLTLLLRLPGIGPYTARAVLAFAFERDVGVVDTNIARVLARASGERLSAKRAQSRADELVPLDQGWLWNQTLMDVGAVLCRPEPHCGECPVAPTCAWHRSGHRAPDPAVGSAGVSVKQSRFDGSDRQARGTVLRQLDAGPRPAAEFDDRILATLLLDGLIEQSGGDVRLPR